MAYYTPVVTVNELLSLNYEKHFRCDDALVTSEKTVYGIGNAYVPDHDLTCSIPMRYGKTYPHKLVKVQVHIIWLETNHIFGYSGIVIDKTDYRLYWLDVQITTPHNYHYCAFQEFTLEQIAEKAVEHNRYLNNAINLAMHNREKLLDYQVYSNMSDRFYYMEIPFDDKVVMCGAGLHTNELLTVGLLGKAKNKDFFVSYAECTYQAYEQLKAQSPCLYERAQQMEKNRPFFSYINVFFEKRRKYPELANLLLSFQKEPLSTRNVVFLGASANGTKMHQYQGPAYYWMEQFVLKYRRIFR